MLSFPPQAPPERFAETSRVGNDTYIIAVNESTAPVKVTFAVTSKVRKSGKVLKIGM